MSISVNVVTVGSDEEEYESTDEDLSEDLSEDDEGSLEFSDEEEDFDEPSIPSTARAPVTPISVSVVGKGAPTVFLPPSQVQVTPTFEVLPTGDAIGPVSFETVVRNLIVRAPPGYLDAYETYLRNLRGKKDERTGDWIYNVKQEPQVKELVNRIVNRQLPPPNELPIPSSQQVSIDINAVGQLPARPPLPATEIMITPSAVPEPTPTRRRRQAAPTPTVPTGPTYLPSQAIAATMPTSIIPQTTTPVTPVPQVPLPPYDPLTKEPTESQQEYERRRQLYLHLSNLVLPGGERVPSESADILSRMRNQVDIHGVRYAEAAMDILNTYLPLQQ